VVCPRLFRLFPIILQPGGKQLRFDVEMVEFDFVAQLVVMQAVAKQRDDAGLRFLFDLADSDHEQRTLVLTMEPP